MRRLLHICFAALAGILVARAVVETVRADARRAKAAESISQVLNSLSPTSPVDADPRAAGVGSSANHDPESVSNSMNCTSIDFFEVAPPARTGFVCFSQGRTAHPLTIFMYDPGLAPTVNKERTRRACDKARTAGQRFVYLLSTDALFVYTTSSQAMEASAMSGRFEALDARTCS